MSGRRRGTTLVEILVVVAIGALLLALLQRGLSHLFAGTRRGYETLSVMQEEGRFLSYLKHDLRTLVMGAIPDIPPPELVEDVAGTARLVFYKVEEADEFGRPLPVRVEYERSAHTRPYVTATGRTCPAWSLVRRVGTGTGTNGQPGK